MMKRILIACGLLLAARNAFTQGLVLFYLRVSGTSHIYAPNPSSPSLSMIGQGPNDAVPSGTTDWSGWTPIGGNGLTGQYGAQSTFTSLLGAPGSNAAESTLLPGALGTALGGGTATTFRTGPLPVLTPDKPQHSTTSHPMPRSGRSRWLPGTTAAASIAPGHWLNRPGRAA